MGFVDVPKSWGKFSVIWLIHEQGLQAIEGNTIRRSVLYKGPGSLTKMESQYSLYNPTGQIILMFTGHRKRLVEGPNTSKIWTLGSVSRAQVYGSSKVPQAMVLGRRLVRC